MKVIGIAIACVLLNFLAFAEGTKQLMPSNTGQCYVQFNESLAGARPFAKYTNADPLHRLYIHIAEAGEIINLGFKKLSGGTPKFRIKDPSGTIVLAETNVPTSGIGYISNFTEAETGPSTIFGVGGYTPLTYTTLTTGDYYIEFTSSSSTRVLFEYFDITVQKGSNAIDGRVWAYAWDLNTNSYTNNTYAKFYVYTTDQYVTKIDLNGMQPYSFVVACNSTGVGNTGSVSNDRKSLPNVNMVRPEYKIFLNRPDPAIFPLATPPTMIEDLTTRGTPQANQPVEFFINMSKAGTLEIFLDIDGVPGYQPNGRDVALAGHIDADGDVLIWDGKDNYGNDIEGTITVLVNSRFSMGVTHFPIYDAEKNPNGYIVTRISTGGEEELELYWDDSNIQYGTIPAGQIITILTDNASKIGHPWTTDSKNSEGFGDLHTMNTWWNGFNIDNLRSFNFILLPIELIEWKAEHKGAYIQLSWKTASETNNEVFNIYRSADGVQWHIIGSVAGAGNSNQMLFYTEIDEHPLMNELVYYKLEQIDYNGDNSFSSIIAVGSPIGSQKIKVYSARGNYFIECKEQESLLHTIKLYNLNGQLMNNAITIVPKTDGIVSIDISMLAPGSYVLKTSTESRAFTIY